MSGLVLIIFSFIALVLGYKLYGSFIVGHYDIDDSRKTPAHRLRDNVDYVPAKWPILLGHHFASIAGAAPIIGPVTAIVYGWLPGFIWIIIGGIFMGAVHDFTALIASVRNDGKSIGDIIEKEVGKVGKFLFLIFVWVTLVLVIAVFTFVVAKTFDTSPQTASTSIFFILLAMIFGLINYKKPMSMGILTIFGLFLIVLGLFLGVSYPISLPHDTWIYIILVYIIFASILPVWLLLQPRDFLSSFLLYAILLLGFISIILYNPQIKMPVFTSFYNEKLGYLFPILFVTIACGAISGFHSLVSSGTSSKQLDKESDAKIVGYGGMLIESFLAVIALITAGYLTHGEYIELIKQKGPIAVFASGIATFGEILKLPKTYLVTFATLAVSAFALTSLDTATRLARFAWQELFSDESIPGNKVLSNKYVATLITVAAGGYLALSGYWREVWPLFGSANQLLAALALLGGYLWLRSQGKKNLFFIYLPLVFMYIITLSALLTLIYKNFNVSILRTIIASILFLLAVVLLIISFVKITKKEEER